MKFLNKYSVPAKLSFVFQNAPSAQPDGDLQSPEALAEIIGERESLEAVILTDLTAGIEARLANSKVPIQSVIALSDLLKAEDSMIPEDFKNQFNQIWSQVPEEIKSSIIAAASTGADPVDNSRDPIVVPTEEVDAGEAGPESNDRGPIVVPKETATAVPYEPTPEMAAKSAEMLTFYQGFKGKMEGLFAIDGVDALLASIGVTNQEMLNTMEVGLNNPPNIVVHTLIIRQAEFWQENEGNIDKLISGSATPAEIEAFNSKANSFLSTTMQEVRALATEHSLPMPNMPGISNTAADAAIESGNALALIKGVPESMQTMFASEYEAWSADMRVPGATLTKFNDYLVAQAGGDKGKLSTIALKIQLAGFIEMLKPFLDMFKSLTGQAEEETEDPDAPTEEEQRVAAEREAGMTADRAAGIDEAEIPGRANYRETADYLNNRGVVIKDAMGEDGKIDYELLMNLPASTEIQNPREIKAIVDQIKSKEWGAQVLAVGLSLNALNDLRNINVVDDVAIDDTPPDLILNIGGEFVTNLSDEDNRDSAIGLAVLAYVESAPARLADATEAAETAAQAEVSRSEFLVKTKTNIIREAIGWDNNVMINDSDNDTKGFTGRADTGTIYVDLNDGGLDWQAGNLSFAIDGTAESNGYENWDGLLNAIREEFKGKTLADIRNN